MEELNSSIREGDRARDAGDPLAAAHAYERALILAPGRTDIRVQYANMLKDSSRFAEAEAAYRHAVLERPNDSDIHLQLGHLFKVQGRRFEAINSYEQALSLNPANGHARRELVDLGSTQHQVADFFERLKANRLDLLPILTDEVARIRRQLEQIVSILPEVHSQAALPFALYETYRDLHDIPAPPRSSSDPHIDLVMLIDGEELNVIYQQIESVLDQTHRRFSLFAVGCDHSRKHIIDRLSCADTRVSWVETKTDQVAPASERQAILRGAGDWIVVIAPSAILHPRALAWFAEATTLGASAFVCDEEVRIYNELAQPQLKPIVRSSVDFDALLEMNVYGQTIAVKREAYLAATSSERVSSLAAARSALLLDLAAVGPIGHIPLPLVRRKPIDASLSKEGAHHAQGVKAHIASRGISNRVSLGAEQTEGLPLPILWHAHETREMISIVVPTRDNAIDLTSFVHTMRTHATAPTGLHFLIVDNGGADKECQAQLDRLGTTHDTQLIRIDEPFNWSRLNNAAIAHTNAPIVLFANDDMVMSTHGWDERLRGLLARPEIGAVGAKLLYPDDSIQHAGILFNWHGSTIHDGVYEPRDAAGPANRWILTRSASAVTGAFLATRRETFLRLGGFDEAHLPVAYSDIDYALKLRADGFKVLWTPHIVLYHYESKSRGLDHLDPERRARNASELAVLRRRWGAALDFEPTLNPIWVQATLPFRLISAVGTDRLVEYMRRGCLPQPWRPIRASPKGSAFPEIDS